MWRRGLDPLRKLTRGDLRGVGQIDAWRALASSVHPTPLPAPAPSLPIHSNGPAEAARLARAESAADVRLTAGFLAAAAAAAAAGSVVALGLSPVYAEAPEAESSNSDAGVGREGSNGAVGTALVGSEGAGPVGSVGAGPVGPAVGNKHTARWRVFTDRGRELFSQGRLRDAERYLQRAVEEAKEGFGPSDPHVASSCNNLAELYRVMGEWAAAERLFLEAAERLRQAEMPLPLAATLHNLGGLYLQQGKLGQAGSDQAQLEKARVCYELKAKELGLSHADYANTMFHLAEVFRRLGRWEEAQALLRGSVKILEDSGGSRGTAAMARRMMLLAQMLVQAASTPPASPPSATTSPAPMKEQQHQQHQQQQQQQQGQQRGSMGFSEGDIELLREAERLQRRAIHAVEMAEGTEAPSLAGMLASLAATLEKQKRLEEAREFLLRSLHLRQTALGSDHFLVASTLTPLAAVTLQMLTRQRTSADASKGEQAKEDAEQKEQLEDTIRAMQRAVRIARKAWQQAAEKLNEAPAASPAAAADDARSEKADPARMNRSRPPPPACLTLLVQSLATSARTFLTALCCNPSHTQRQQLSEQAASALKELVHTLSTEPARALVDSSHGLRVSCLSALQQLTAHLRDHLRDGEASKKAIIHAPAGKAASNSDTGRSRDSSKASIALSEKRGGRGERQGESGVELKGMAERLDLLIGSMTG
ncbi:hypothetical protein CLOM_g19329 [Closterium sp. NIES-68]|nr:hypothetical protein CLOM_g19329 [Closterium sp. NIES-68]GJP58955.1 hypothetical protein CLOP_g6721 [Closterium sp. NIES-67]